MLDYIFRSPDGGTALKVAAALIPTITFLWIIITVTALHKRDVYFWSLGSTWTTIIGCPAGILIACFSSLGSSQDPSAALFSIPLIAGLALYAVAFAYSIFYNYNATKSATLAISTSMLQQLAVLGVIYLFVRWDQAKANRRRIG